MMTTNHRRLFFCSAVVVLTMGIFSGCSSSVQITAERYFSASEIIASVNASADSIQTFSAYGSINIETPAMTQGAGFDLAVKKPDSIRIIVEGPFGITIAKVFFTKQRFIAYNALNNTVYNGDPSKGIQTLPMMSSFPPEVLIDAMSGVRRFTDTDMEPDSFYVTENFYTIVIAGKQSTSTFTIDPNSMRIANVTTIGLNRELLLVESYSYQRMDNGQWKPSTARIVVPKKSVALDVSFDEVTINGQIESMMISIPEDAEQSLIQ